jgi:ribosomal-protein-alanine N-acetyltransferase
VFIDAAEMMVAFAFETVGVHRLEARAAVKNGRGNGALRKLGATREGVLRSAFQGEHARFDHVMWSMLAEDWAKSAGDPGAAARGSDEYVCER